MTSFPFLKQTDEGTLLNLYIQPKSSKNELAGLHQHALKVRLTAPPVEGEANKECVKFLAKLFRVPKSAVQIRQGHKSRHKTVFVKGRGVQDIETVLQQNGLS